MASSMPSAISEAFVFQVPVSLTCQIRYADRDVTRAIDKLSPTAQGIGGGTKIGQVSPRSIVGRRCVINLRTAAMIVSDGYDTGAPEQLVRKGGACAAAAAGSSG